MKQYNKDWYQQNSGGLNLRSYLSVKMHQSFLKSRD